MSADLETNITLTGTKDELASYIKVLKVFANDNNKRYTTNRDCVYIHWAKLSSKEILLNLDDATDKEITDFLEGCDKTIFVSAAGPYGAYGDFEYCRVI